jgi:hypothetical protein
MISVLVTMQLLFYSLFSNINGLSRGAVPKLTSFSLQLPLEKTAEALSRLGDETDVVRGVT